MASGRPPGAGGYVPEGAGIDELRAAAQRCRGCDLYADATQAVFGQGDPRARVLLVGEQPGDQEDLRGAPFVGPAGRVLDRGLTEAGIDRGDAYVTNAVKHFRFARGSGKRRIHKTPEAAHVTACRPWLDAELAATDPQVVVTLGAVAGRALLGSTFRVGRERGLPRPFRAPGGATDRWLVPTIHPSAVLRAEDREAVYAGFASDLRVAAGVLI